MLVARENENASSNWFIFFFKLIRRESGAVCTPSSSVLHGVSNIY